MMAEKELNDLLQLLEDLIGHLEGENSDERQIEEIALRIRDKTMELWKYHEEGKIVTNLEPLTKVMRDFFMSELPQAIKDVELRGKVKNELKLSKKIINDLLQPKVVDGS